MKHKLSGNFLEDFIFYKAALKYVQKIQKPSPLSALFTTIFLYV